MVKWHMLADVFDHMNDMEHKLDFHYYGMIGPFLNLKNLGKWALTRLRI